MASNPREIVSIGKFQPYTHPEYGPGAVRWITYIDGTRELRFLHYDTAQEGESPEAGYIVRKMVDPEMRTDYERTNKPDEASKPNISHVERNGEIYTITTPANGGAATIVGPNGPVSKLPDQGPSLSEQRLDQQTKETKARQEEQDRQTEARRQATTVKEQHTDEDGTEWTQYEDGHWVQKGPSLADRRAQAAYNRPSIISAPPGQRKIAQQDNEGNITSVDNPNFDEAAYQRQAAKEQAQAERDRLSLMIEAGKLTEASAAAQYKRWFDENVTLPIQRAQEARARAAELRAAQEAEDRRQQFAASYEKDRQTTAIQAGNQAANTFNSNLQYQVGPKFGEQFAGALNSLSGGPPQQFTADAFTFKGPSIEAVARKATAKALAGISPYAQAIAAGGQREPQVASYGPGTDIPDIAPSAAPPPSTPPDYAGMINQYLQNNPYVPGGSGEEDQ